MGIAIDAIVAYGYDLGGPGEWEIEEAIDGRWPVVDDGITDFEVPEMIENALRIAPSGDVHLVRYRDIDKPRFILAAFHDEARFRAARRLLSPKDMERRRTSGRWDGQLDAAMAALGVTPKAPRGLFLAPAVW